MLAFSVSEPEPGSNPLSFDELCVPNYELMVRFANKLTDGDAQRTADVVQDSFIKAFQAWPRWTPDGDPVTAARAWLYRIVQNTYMHDYHRVKNNRRRASESRNEIMLATYGHDVEPDLRDNVDSPFGDEVAEALASLSTEHRAVIDAFYVREVGCSQIAEDLGIPKNTVFTRLHRAKAALVKALARFAREEYNLQGKPLRRRVHAIETPEDPQSYSGRVDRIVANDDDGALEDADTTVDEIAAW